MEPPTPKRPVSGAFVPQPRYLWRAHPHPRGCSSQGAILSILAPLWVAHSRPGSSRARQRLPPPSGRTFQSVISMRLSVCLLEFLASGELLMDYLVKFRSQSVDRTKPATVEVKPGTDQVIVEFQSTVVSRSYSQFCLKFNTFKHRSARRDTSVYRK